jgi:UDP-N-acetylglucosamine acyltransferase
VIHQTAIISPKAKIPENTKIGPYCIIGDRVSIEEGCELISNVHLSGNTKIGKNNKFFPFSSVGSIPQDLKYSGEDSKLVIGNNNTFRENVTINPGTRNGGMITKIEDNCLFMVGSHVAHDCQISSNVILANNATLAGHVVVNHNAIIGGLSAVHQFVHIGKYAMIGGMSGVESNIIPYGLYLGIRDNLRGLNIIGLKRKNVDIETISKIKKIFRKIFSKKNSIDTNIENLYQKEKSIIEIAEILDFISLNLKRGICRYVNE